MRILLDIDGTICQTIAQALKLLGRDFGKNLDYNAVDDIWVTRAYGLSDEEGDRWWEANEPLLYGAARPMPWALNTVRNLQRHHEIHIVTAREGRARRLTEEWLRRHGFPYQSLIMDAVDKVSVSRTMGLDLAIEDDPRHLVALGQVMPVIAIDAPYNRGVEAPGVVRARDWRSVGRLVREAGQRSRPQCRTTGLIAAGG